MGKKFFVNEIAEQALCDYVENRDDFLYEAIRLEKKGKIIIIPQDLIRYYVENVEDICKEAKDFNC